MLKHPLFRSPTVLTGVAKWEVGADADVVVTALRTLKRHAEAGEVEYPGDGICYNLHEILRYQGMPRARADRLQEWLVYGFTGRELPIRNDSLVYEELWEREQLVARLELIDALIQDIEA